MLNVGMIGARGDFDTNPHGSGVRRYSSELYNSIKDKSHVDISIDKIEVDNIAHSSNFPVLPNVFRTYGEFDIIHNIRNTILYAPFKSKKTIIVNTAWEFLAARYPELAVEDYSNLKMKVGAQVYLKLHKIAEQRILEGDYAIACSTSAYEDLVALGYEKTRIYIVGMGVDRRFSSKIIKKNKKQFTVGYLGSFIKKKNLLFAISAFKLIDDKNIQMDIWGRKIPTVYCSQIEKTAASDRRIRLRGFALEEKIVDVYDSFDVYVFPVLRGGFEMGILEAQARGVPVIIYKKSRLPKEVRKYCFEARNEEEMADLITTIKNSGYNHKSRKKAIEYARSFTWQKTVNKTLDAYKDIKNRQ